MFRWLKTSLVVLLVLALAPFHPAQPVQAQARENCDYFGTQVTGALYCISMPTNWNGDLFIFAHGYVAASKPLAIPLSQATFTNGVKAVSLADVILEMGYAYATTSYSVNGLAVQQGIADILDLIEVFKAQVGTPNHIYLVGASEGGLITTLAVERYPASFSGGLALCGPIGSFSGELNYWDDFRVLFDYFMDRPFYDVIPGTAVKIPDMVMNNWNSYYVPRILSALSYPQGKTAQLMNVSKAPYDPADPNTINSTSLWVLLFNVVATNDARVKLGGQPFDNYNRKYVGSANDLILNRRVKRYHASPAALTEMATKYETSGILAIPLVAMHTTSDPIVPAWHQTLYDAKVAAQNPLAPYVSTYFPRYGHCAFTLTEVLDGFAELVTLVTGGPAPVNSLNLDADTYIYDYR